MGTDVWSGWSSKGSPAGGCTSAPGADWRSTTELFIFCRGSAGNTNAAVWYRQWNGSTNLWSAWTILDSGAAVSVTAPGATDYFQPGDTWHLNVYAKQGTASSPTVKQNYKSTGGFLGWNLPVGGLGGTCASAPNASDLPITPFYLYVFCRWDPGPNSPSSAWDGGIYYRRWDNTNWGVWTSLGLHAP